MLYNGQLFYMGYGLGDAATMYFTGIRRFNRPMMWCLAGCLTLTTFTAQTAQVVRRELEPGVMAISKDGRTLGLEVRLSGRNAVQGTVSKYLAKGQSWALYKGRQNFFVSVEKLKSEYRRTLLLAVFERDGVNNEGWWHTAVFDGETLWTLCEWITGSGANYKKVLSDERNRGVGTTLVRGEQVLIPAALLRGEMKKVTARSVRVASLRKWDSVLEYATDGQGMVAVYKLKKGETLYSSVVARFTDYTVNDDIVRACKMIAARSGITNVRDIDAGQLISIPVEILSDKYRPAGSRERIEYEATLQEAVRLTKAPIRSRDLSDVVVVLDPGHGGQDYGAHHSKSALYEDELNYDIACRIRELLKAETGARVYMTMKDRSAGFGTTDRARFVHDTDEELLTEPHHSNNVSASVSANLRWMMANSIYDKEVRRGVDSRKVIFTSIHTDSIFNSRHRGVMVYIPGAKYRRGEEVRRDAVYSRYAEGRNFNRFSSSSSERRTDEAVSRNFANVLLTEFGRKRIKRHDTGDPIRTVVRRSKTKVYVPAVIRNTKIPTKVLIETANLQNATDRKRLADPWWRQQFARAYVDALKVYYGARPVAKVAQAD